jgi:hypothetical protein
VPQRFHFKIDPKTPLKDLLPAPPALARSTEQLPTADLATVPEVRFQEPGPRDLPPGKALEQTAYAIAKINHLNAKRTDGFLQELLNQRPDLAGLPFAMGDACRTTGERSRQFNVAVATVRRVLQQAQQGPAAARGVAVVTALRSRMPQPTVFSVAVPDAVAPSVAPPPPRPPAPTATPPLPSSPVREPAPQSPRSDVAPGLTPVAEAVQRQVQALGGELRQELQGIRQEIATQVADAVPGRDAADTFWDLYEDTCADEDRNAVRRDRGQRETVALARVAALMQVLAAEPPSLRLGLVRYLAGVPYAMATRALAKLALFSPEEEICRAAVDALQVRRERDYTDVLLAGFRYPLPAVAKRAADALVKLERKDLVPQLVALLDEPDPRAPSAKEVNGKKVAVVHELVRLNHHRSCLLCHAPGNTPTVAPDTLTASVPIPGEPLPPSSQGYNNPTIPDILVRLDVTYLRQDFSALLPVSDANPWPEMQRFDFVVRSRELTDLEAKAYQDKLGSREPGVLPPHRRAALAALRELTGRDTAPTAEAWRKLLNQSEG